jgi:hypothetical protein
MTLDDHQSQISIKRVGSDERLAHLQSTLLQLERALCVAGKIVSDCSTLNSASSGLYFVPPGVNCNINAQVGTPSAPIALVIEGTVGLQAQSIFYGMVFIKRGIGAPATVSVAGGVQIYGSMVSEGTVNTNGTPAYIYDETVLKNLGNSPSFQRFGVLPGSWSDADTF